MRESNVRGPAVDIEEFERRLRGAERISPDRQDPLSELARLMHDQEEPAADPYGHLLADPRAPRQEPPSVEPHDLDAHWDEPAAHSDLRGSYDAAAEHQPYSEQSYRKPDYAAAAGYHEEPYEEEAYQDPRYAPAQGYADQYGSAQYGSAPQGAEGGWTDDTQYLDYGAEEAPLTPPPARGLRDRLRPWHAIAAISVLAIGSIGWGLAHRSGVGGSREIATIEAPEGPMKVRPSAETDQDKPNASGAAVLDRKEAEPVKQVVTHQEQAVDPSVSQDVVKLGDGPVDAPHEAPSAAQPHRVKTVTVRPDGSPADNAAALPPAVAKAAAPPMLAGAPVQTGTPKAQTKPATTNQAAKPKPTPKQVAAAQAPAAEAAAPVAGGGYAVQFGAAGSEAEARALVKTVSAKYGAQLGGHKPSFKPAKVGDKTVYRVRVAGVSKEAANGICGKVKAGGGSCFVAGN